MLEKVHQFNAALTRFMVAHICGVPIDSWDIGVLRVGVDWLGLVGLIMRKGDGRMTDVLVLPQGAPGILNGN